jgi:hypothetical protein
MRLSRPCYDKPHRCPGWAGGGWKSSKADRCENGSICTNNSTGWWVLDLSGHPGEHRWRFGRCTKCDVVTWPYNIRFVDPTNYIAEVRLWLDRRKWKRESRL